MSDLFDQRAATHDRPIVPGNIGVLGGLNADMQPFGKAAAIGRIPGAEAVEGVHDRVFVGSHHSRVPVGLRCQEAGAKSWVVAEFISTRLGGNQKKATHRQDALHLLIFAQVSPRHNCERRRLTIVRA